MGARVWGWKMLRQLLGERRRLLKQLVAVAVAQFLFLVAAYAQSATSVAISNDSTPSNAASSTRSMDGGASGAAAMNVPGVAGVTPTGAFTYSIPIVVPPGTTGLVPSLSLNYSSSAGDGLEGLGWYLGGLSAITRCPRTIAQDSVHGGVNYDMNDRYCLNGQRLILTQGTYGQEGSIYHTEIETFTEVIAHCDVSGACTSANGPDWFEVHTKSGQILQFGNTTASTNYSRIFITNPPSGSLPIVREWLENNVQDLSGNYYTVAYDSGLQAYPTIIKYTGHVSGPTVATNNEVRFEYATRSNVYKVYQAGSWSEITKLLTNIETYANSTLVSNYIIGYNLAGSGTAQQNELNSIKRCNDSGGTSCLAQTTFGWQGSRDTINLEAPKPEHIAQGGSVLSGDWNGDGLTDALVDSASDTYCNLYVGTQDGDFTVSGITVSYYDWSTGSPVWTPNAKPCFHNSATYDTLTQTPVDFTGDGLSDLAITQSEDDSGIAVQALTNTPMTPTNTLVQSKTDANFYGTLGGLGDFDGDGLTDLVITPQFATTGTIYTSKGDGTFKSGSAIDQGTFADFDGDGCTDDFSVKYTPLGYASVVYSCQPAVPVVGLGLTFVDGTVVTGDFNGDGKTDIVWVVGDTTTTNGLYLSTGTGFAAQLPVPSAFSQTGAYNLVVGDFNGDGKDDIAIISAADAAEGGVTSTIYLSTGSGFVQAKDAGGNPITLAGFGDANITDWNNDGAADIWFQQDAGDELYFINYVPELISSVSNGLCASPCSTTTVTYDRLNHGTIYTKGSGASYPTQDVINSSYVVASIASNNGVGGSNSISYAYAGAKQDLQGRGFLGFSSVTATDHRTGILTTTNYSTLFPLTGTPTEQIISQGATTLSDIKYTFTATNLGATLSLVELTETNQTVRNDLDGTAMPTVDTTYTYDAYANPHVTTKTISFGGSVSSTTTQIATWTNDSTNWILGQPLTQELKSTVGTDPQLVRHWSFTTDPATGLVKEAITEPSTSLELDVNYAYDAFGNQHTVQQSGSNIATRTTTFNYDSRGEFLSSVNRPTPSSGIAQTEYFGFDARFGSTASHTDVNGQVTSVSYDAFGRAIQQVNPDLTGTQTTYNYCSGINGGATSCGANGAFWVDTTSVLCSDATCDTSSTIGPYLKTEQDMLFRPMLTYTQGFSGNLIKQSTVYDAQLHVFKTSRPIFDGGSYAYTSHTYDALDRLTESDFPDGSKTTDTYDGLSSAVVNDLNQKTTTVLNPQSLVASVARSASFTTTFSYDSFGNATLVTSPGGHTITNTFDVLGRKLSSLDNDTGGNAWTYTYDVLSELLTQTDSKSQTTTISYDALGRPTSRVEADMTSTWTWDTAANGVGKLAEVCNATPCASATYSYAPTYDTLGRAVSDKLQINGVSYTYGLGYDADGRLNHITYPSGFRSDYAYTSLSYLLALNDHSTGNAIWTANAADAELHLTQSTAGNGVITNNDFDLDTGALETIDVGVSGASHSLGELSYQWDTIGNLLNRQDVKENFTESFCYDTLNRLTSYALTTSTTCPVTASGAVTVSYSTNGNISAKSDVGTYHYGASAAGDHAVSSITGTVEGVTNPNFFYDENGNMHCMTTGTDCSSPYNRRIDWTSFNMVSQIYDHITGSEFGFVYDTNHARIEQCSPTCASPTSTIFYLTDPATGALEETTFSGSTATSNDYISAPGGIVAVRSLSGGASSYLYLASDHLGSVTLITDSTGGLVPGGRQSYDPWGLRRNDTGAPASSCNAISSATTRGFTQQEETDASCLINLNARIYDPTIGRMLSADPTVPNPLNTQSYNRYSYVNNGPLSATDPSGYAPPACGDPTGWCEYTQSEYLQYDPAQPWPFGIPGSGPITWKFQIVGGATITCSSSDCGSVMDQILAGNNSGVIFQFPQAGFSDTFSFFSPPSEDSFTDSFGVENVSAICGCIQTFSPLGTNGGSYQPAAFGYSDIPVPPNLAAVGVRALYMQNGNPNVGWTHIFNRHTIWGNDRKNASTFHASISANGDMFETLLEVVLPFGVPTPQGTSIAVNINMANQNATGSMVGWDQQGLSTSSMRVVLIPSAGPMPMGPGYFQVQTSYPTPGGD